MHTARDKICAQLCLQSGRSGRNMWAHATMGSDDYWILCWIFLPVLELAATKSQG